MKILHFSPLFLPEIGGSQIAAHNLCLQLADRGHDVEVVCNARHAKHLEGDMGYPIRSLKPRTISTAIRLENLGFQGKQPLKWQMRRIVRRTQPDLVHAHMAYPGGYRLSRILPDLGIPALVTCQGVDVQKEPRAGYGFRLNNKLEKRIGAGLRRFDAVCVVGESMLEDMGELGVDVDRVHYVPTGAAVERIASIPCDREAVRSRFGIPKDRFAFVTVGRNHPKKGYQFIVPIAKELAKHRRDFVFVIVGRGLEPIETSALANGVGDLVLTVAETGGTRSEHKKFDLPSNALVELIKACDACFLPTLIEGMPLVLVEAMAASLPVVTTDAPGCRHFIENGVHGSVARVGNIEDLVRQVSEVLDAPSSRLSEMGNNCFRRSSEFAWSKIVTRYETIYAEIASRKNFSVSA